MAKKLDKAVERLSKDLKKLRKQNEQLVKTLEKAREDQAEAYREIRNLLEERLPARDAGPAEPVEEDHTGTDENLGEAEITWAEDRARDADAVDPEADRTPEAESEEAPEVTEAAERRAKDLGVNPSEVKGTGSGGRVLVKDVEAAANGGR